ncbi:MAG: tryptophan-rich sensory protein [Deltaproteobacteria bacterium]|nr:tryptophan-rich sensory protein [Deltaproteobacteria bacterium]
MRQHRKRSIKALVIFLVISFLPALVGSMFRPDAWYEGLVKPALNPPNWIFGPVWTCLYALMGISAWLVWLQRQTVPVRSALVLFGIQLLFNGLWTFIFFGLRRPGLAFVDIVILWAAIACTLAAFWGRSRYAALLLIPYLLWVSFAVYLNFELWRLNMVTN